MSELTMKRKGIFSLAFLMTPYIIAGNVAATDIIDGGESGLVFSGELIQTTCDVRFNNDFLLIDPIGIDDLSVKGSVSSLKKDFVLYVENCILSPQVISTIKLTFNSLESDGKTEPGAFINQATDSASQRIDNGVGFAVYDQRDNQNVLSNTGESRTLSYTVSSAAPLSTARAFYVKYMQTGTTVTAGPVNATLLVSAFYE